MRRIVITHFHPDHVGAASDLAELTGAPVSQGRVDYQQCALVWGGEDWSGVLVEWFRRHGVPAAVTDELIEQGSAYRPYVRFQRDPDLLDPGDLVDGWQVVAAPGHADGQLMLLRDGVLVAADHILDRISPTVGLWPASRPDPLGDYLGALDWRGHKQTKDWYAVMKSRPAFRPLLGERMEVIVPPAHYDKVDF